MFAPSFRSPLLSLLFLPAMLLVGPAALAQGAPFFAVDLGPAASEAAPGFLPVSHEDAYDPDRGRGWVLPPERSFVRQRPIQPAYPEAFDGAATSTAMTFRMDVAPGAYFLTLTLGYAQHDSSFTQVLANDKVLIQEVATPWRRLPHRTVRQKIDVDQPYLELAFRPARPGKLATVQAIELYPAGPYEALASPSALEADTALLGKQLRQWQTQLARGAAPNPGFLQGRVAIYRNFLKAAYFYDIGWWSWAVEETGMSIFNRFHAASDLLQQILADPEDPLYDQAAYLLGKLHYWLYKEQEYEQDLQAYPYFFGLISDQYADHRLLRMYRGEPIFHPIHCPMPMEAEAPEWAKLQREAMCRMQEIIHWWVEQRQAPNGELGGKFGDDVEILRWWLPAILGADDSLARLGYTRLANGVWDSGLLERGYSKKVEDVEHAAELFRDTHPVMLLLNYGDPRFVERCLISMQNLRDVWTTVNPQGQRLFRSAYFSATEVVEGEPYGVDVAMNARATLAGLWAAWYNQNPTLLRLFSEWGQSWIAAAQRTDKGKPPGLLPAAIGPDGEIGGYSENWYHPELGWKYYQWERIGGINEMYNQLLGMYALTGNDDFLEPVNQTLALATQTPHQRGKLEAGTAAWAAHYLRGDHKAADAPGGGIGMANLAKSLTGSSRYDEFLKQHGSAYARYVLSGDPADIVEGCQQLLASLRYNYPLKTTEVKFTDRVYVPMDQLLFGMYTGHMGSGFEYPALAVSWKRTGKDVAVLVNGSSRQSLKVSLFNFTPQEKEVGMKLWQLEAGNYEMRLKDQASGRLLYRQSLNVRERAQEVPLRLPGQQSCVLEIRQLRATPSSPTPLPDLAFSEESIQFLPATGPEPPTIRVQVHNIGRKQLRNARIELWINGRKMASKRIKQLAAPNDLNPQHAFVDFSWKTFPGTYHIQVKGIYGKEEITKVNNQCARKLTLY